MMSPPQPSTTSKMSTAVGGLLNILECARAMAALPFESPKLAVTAINNMSGEDFARLLDRAIARSRNPPQ